ncbi:MAG: KAP family NTPase [Bacteroidales bacterium]|jgi:predicted KAP-like P-loop ATPase|nr:KAP family NTPase [Bacteroidales bacterium]
MWNDNVTDKDFLGFDIHVALIKAVIQDDTMLPTTIGVFGDWGSGKSSILEMLRKTMEDEDGVVCLYFNGWVFEGYDDAKAALLESIIKNFNENTKIKNKATDSIKKLFKSINWMRTISFSLKNVVVPVTAGIMTNGLSLISQLFSKLQSLVQDPTFLVEKIKTYDEESFKKEFLNTDGGNNNFGLVREFRDEFEKMLDESEIKKLVVIIDDLDRCLPDRIIDNLEAIKLFLNVKNTAFIIGTDPRIVRHAIEYRYKNTEYNANNGSRENRIIDDYLEKLIQIPYNLPKLSDSEVETYLSLLFCENDLENESFAKVMNAFKAFREQDRYSVFNFNKIKEIISVDTISKLENDVSLITKLSPIISESLYGNPRQIKRFLNTFMLRKKLAEVSKIRNFQDDILAKLMILEYVEPTLFDKLYLWQISNSGIAKQLEELEKICKNDTGRKEFSQDVKDWEKPKIIKWLSVEPFLARYDLRDYFWISRDRLSSMQSNLLIPPSIKLLLIELDKEDMAGKLTREIIKKQLAVLSGTEQDIFFKALSQRIVSEPKRKRPYDIFHYCLEENIDCISFYVGILDNVRNKLTPAVIESLRNDQNKYPQLARFIPDKKKMGNT